MVTDPDYALAVERRQADYDADLRLAPCDCDQCCAGVGR